MKSINNEAILDIIYDLADRAGLRIDEFIARVEEEFGEQPIDETSLPKEVVEELRTSREALRKQRASARAEATRSEISDDIKRFREIFPEVSAEEIPESVWEEVHKGVSLAHAYALWTVTGENLNRRAADINRRNEQSGAAVKGESAAEPVFTKEQVEKMNGRDVKSNYKNILKAMKNWRFN